ncbi:MAG TPA: glycerol-3-phosphate acyltransferase, partial [Pseudoxanthomonas mexicana]|nr:glycerol-3-phosphate acyltransferase [Pseudoxanthomonas mexicana]
AWLAVLAAALGHVWPLWHGFRGGKGVGTLLGGVAVLWPVALLPLFLVWVCVLVASGYVGLASIIATACLLPLAVWLRADVATQAFAAVAALLVLFTHRANVQRLRAGTESRFERVRFWRRRA